MSVIAKVDWGTGNPTPESRRENFHFHHWTWALAAIAWAGETEQVSWRRWAVWAPWLRLPPAKARKSKSKVLLGASSGSLIMRATPNGWLSFLPTELYNFNFNVYERILTYWILIQPLSATRSCTQYAQYCSPVAVDQRFCIVSGGYRATTRALGSVSV